MARPRKQNKLEIKADPDSWIPRKEAARILSVSINTIVRWAGPRFRIKWTRDSVSGRKLCFVNAADVERVRLERLGPTMHELEAFVLSELAAGKTPSEIVRSKQNRVTLEDVQRIRELESQLAGALFIHPQEASELRQLLDADIVDGAALVRHVRAIVERVERLAAPTQTAAKRPSGTFVSPVAPSKENGAPPSSRHGKTRDEEEW